MSTAQPPATDFFNSYAPQRGAFDELFQDETNVRPHGQPFVNRVNILGRDEFSRRWEMAQHTIQENGIAYSGYATPQDKPRPWALDPFPVLIPASEWYTVSDALKQRARVMNLVLRDLYGPQTLLTNDVLPPELVFAHPGFRRSYHRQIVPYNCFLHLFSTDLLRANDGHWWVVGDRTESPSGMGYALENRIVISRMFPDVFHQCRVERLATFFLQVQETLRSLSPQQRENPHIVLLSRGPTATNYFEDLYLARYLGYTLVESGDLAVRNRKVMVKTLGGLVPVDVILRRRNSDECDPLGINPASHEGVSGLTEAVRAGNVAIANALGSGLVESSALMAYMPRLCQVLLGEDLQMPNARTWWCGDAQSREFVLNNLDGLVAQPAFRRRGQDDATFESIRSMSMDELRKEILANPHEYAAREKMSRSTVPVWQDGLGRSNVALRAFGVGTNDQYLVMNGALARVSSGPESLEVSRRLGEQSKDTWILSDQPVKHVSLLDEPERPIPLRRSGDDLPSRVADNLFWLGRLLDRAESTAKLVRATARLLVSEADVSSLVELPMLIRCLASQGQIEPGYALPEMRDQLPPVEDVLPHVAFDSSSEGSLRAVLNELCRLGSIVRDRLTRDTWRIIYRIDERFRPFERGTTNLSDILTLTDNLLIEVTAFSGIITESMTRTQSHRFLEMGRRIERSLQILDLLKHSLIPLPERPGPVFRTILEISDSLMTYRSRYLANFRLGPVLDLMLTDETNPRSLAFQFLKLQEHVDYLPREKTQPGFSTEQRLSMSLLHTIRLMDVEEIAERHRLANDGNTLLALVEDFELRVPRLFEAISLFYLVHARPAHQLAEIAPN